MSNGVYQCVRCAGGDYPRDCKYGPANPADRLYTRSEVDALIAAERSQAPLYDKSGRAKPHCVAT